MTGKDILYGLNNIDQDLINECEEQGGQKQKSKPHISLLKVSIAAACIFMVVMCTLDLIKVNDPPYVNPDKIQSNMQEQTFSTYSTENDALVHISMNTVHFNDLDQELASAPIWYNPEMYNTIVWGEIEIEGYYGKELTLQYVPEGLKASPVNGSATVIFDKEGNIVYDTVWLGYYQGYDELGNPQLTDDYISPKGISVLFSKMGLLNDCLYILPDNEIKRTSIEGIDVIFGHRSILGCISGDENISSESYYDIYVAEFLLDGIDYNITASQMSAKEFVKTVAVIISGDVNICVDD